MTILCQTHNVILRLNDDGDVSFYNRSRMFCVSALSPYHEIFYDSDKLYCQMCSRVVNITDKCACGYSFFIKERCVDRPGSIHVKIDDLYLKYVYLTAASEHSVSKLTPVILLPEKLRVKFSLIVAFKEDILNINSNLFGLHNVFIKGYSPYQSIARRIVDSDTMFVPACLGTIYRKRLFSEKELYQRSVEITEAYESCPEGQLYNLPDNLSNPIFEYLEKYRENAVSTVWEVA